MNNKIQLKFCSYGVFLVNQNMEETSTRCDNVDFKEVKEKRLVQSC